MGINTVGIGMPVYNGGETIAAAIESVLNQSWTDFELVISDNASTDSTEEICRRYAVEDNRIRYVRQSKNLGAGANFKYVFEQTSGEYFMWAAADDLRSTDFLEVNLNFLESNPSYVASTSPVRFSEGDFNPEKMGDIALSSENPHERLAQHYSKWHANGRFYSLLKREHVEGWKHLDESFFGVDWTLINLLASKGKIHRHDFGWVVLGREGLSSTDQIIVLLREHWLDRLCPFRRLTIDTLSYLAGCEFRYQLRILWRLSRMNFSSLRFR